ncbi:MAG: hydrogenase nickel incorporation protein HypB [Acholeplasmatales bacterium]|nr:hydrogenase nickel incorporation protein HypB [Acholeplasmatales bacterium]
MSNLRVIEIKESVFKENEVHADELRNELKNKKTFLLNVMASPGAGKTTTLVNIINKMKNKYKIAVMEADIDSLVDAKKIIEETGVEAVQIHTGGMCHLDATMTKEGLKGLKDNDYDLVILENVGNLVCPAEFDTGAIMSMNILSVPEGDDKPLKYPLMFQVCDLVVINKIDVMPYFNFSLEKVKENIKFRNPKAEIIPISALKDDNVDLVVEYLENQIKNWRD